MASLDVTLENGQKALKIVGDIVLGWQNGGFRGRSSIDYVNDTQLKVNLDVLPPNRLARLVTAFPKNVEPQRHGDDSLYYILSDSRLQVLADLVKHCTMLA